MSKDELLALIEAYGVLRYRLGCCTAKTSEKIMIECAAKLNEIKLAIDEFASPSNT